MSLLAFFAALYFISERNKESRRIFFICLGVVVGCWGWLLVSEIVPHEIEDVQYLNISYVEHCGYHVYQRPNSDELCNVEKEFGRKIVDTMYVLCQKRTTWHCGLFYNASFVTTYELKDKKLSDSQ
jgi:hypothetical protein